MLLKRSTMRWIALLLIISILGMGAETTVQEPTNPAEAVHMGVTDVVSGNEAKGYIEKPEEANWDSLDVVMQSPEGDTVVVPAEFDDNADAFAFEAPLDEAGRWQVQEIRMDESGQTVVQSIEPIEVRVAETADGPSIEAASLQTDEVLSAEEYVQALTAIHAVDEQGKPAEIHVRVEGAVEQEFTFFNDGLEKNATAPIEFDGTGEYTITLTAEGAEPVTKTVTVEGEPGRGGPSEPMRSAAEAELNAVVEGDTVSMKATASSDPVALDYLRKDVIGAGDPLDPDSAGTDEPPVEREAPKSPYPGESPGPDVPVEPTPLPPLPERPIVSRLAGPSRYETAVAISGTAVIRTDNAIVVSGDSFADALASSSLSRTLNAPILYATKTGVPKATLAELRRLEVKKIYLIGGEGVVSADVQQSLSNEFTVERIAGTTRYETATKIAEFLVSRTKATTALVVNGETSADALVAGSYASKMGMPILYTRSDAMDATTKAYLENRVNRAIIVGGTGSVSLKLQREMEGMGLASERASGSDRYETAVDFARAYYEGAQRVILASGLNEKMPDALAGGALGGLKDAPVLLVQPKSLPNPVHSFFLEKDIRVTYLLGGNGTLSGSVFDEAKRMTMRDDWVPYIMLDPGHGWHYNQGVIPNYFEGEQMLYLAYYLQRELQGYGFKVGVTRMPDGLYSNAYEALLAEKAWAKENKKGSVNNDIYPLSVRGATATNYDLLLSLHSNAPFDISASELWDSVSNPNKELAEKLLKTVVDTFGHKNRGVKYRYNEAGTDWYGILRASGAVNAMLLEHGFHTNRSDTTKLLDFEFLKLLAKREAATLADYYGMSK